jgi:DNA repair protein RadC
MTRINELEIQHRPRERLAAFGASSLSDEELLALLLGAGGRSRDVFALATDLLPILDENWHAPQLDELLKVPGIGPGKASVLVAALEFARRRIRPTGTKIRSAEDVLPLVRNFVDRPQEHFVAISLNGAHEVHAVRVVTIGLVNATQVHPREVFADPLQDRACAIVVAHNHPSGDPTPSNEDRAVTRLLANAGKLLGIKLLDHVVFAKRGSYSFAEAGEL